jgi:hypothetical protein
MSFSAHHADIIGHFLRMFNYKYAYCAEIKAVILRNVAHRWLPHRNGLTLAMNITAQSGRRRYHHG